MTEMKKKKLATAMAFRLVDVARLRSTPGVYVGVTVPSEEAFSAPATPSGGVCSFWALSWCCLRAASDRKVGSVMAGSTPCRQLSNPQVRAEATDDEEIAREFLSCISAGEDKSQSFGAGLLGCGSSVDIIMHGRTGAPEEAELFLQLPTARLQL